MSSHAFYLDVDRCVGCFACAVACMDQNDLEIGAEPTAWRQVFAIEIGRGSRGPPPLRLAWPACTARTRPASWPAPRGAIGREVGTRVVTGQLGAVHRLPQLLHRLSVRGAPLRQGRHHAEVRPLQRAPGERPGAGVRARLPHQGACARAIRTPSLRIVEKKAAARLAAGS